MPRAATCGADFATVGDAAGFACAAGAATAIGAAGLTDTALATRRWLPAGAVPVRGCDEAAAGRAAATGLRAGARAAAGATTRGTEAAAGERFGGGCGAAFTGCAVTARAVPAAA